MFFQSFFFNLFSFQLSEFKKSKCELSVLVHLHIGRAANLKVNLVLDWTPWGLWFERQPWWVCGSTTWGLLISQFESEMCQSISFVVISLPLECLNAFCLVLRISSFCFTVASLSHWKSFAFLLGAPPSTLHTCLRSACVTSCWNRSAGFARLCGVEGSTVHFFYEKKGVSEDTFLFVF